MFCLLLWQRCPSDISKYPTASEIHADDSSLVPPLLRTLMSILVPVKLKRSAISQCIIQAARPRTTIQPIPFGLGIQMDHAFGSWFLIQELARLGLCVSYDEVVRYKQSVVMSQTPQHASAPCYPYAYTQWVADNVDHNVRTLDGFGTLHAMGLISASTAVSGEVGVSSTPVNRLSNRLLSAEVVRNRGIKIVQYHGEECSWLTTISMQPIEQLYKPIECSQLTALNLIWHAGWFTSDVVRPNWSGFMQNVCHGDHSSAATIQFLPILDLNPSDNTCIYSTLLHVIDQAKQLGILTPCITFDMPLWLKAVEISNTKKLPIVCKLGGFHMIMSFLGSIGHLMAGSGLEEILHLNYGKDTVSHILTGKAVARALRSHFLVEGALTIHLLNSHFGGDVDMLATSSLYGTVQSSGVRLDGECDILSDPALQQMSFRFQNLKELLSSQSRTSKLWLLYMKYIGILKLFITAERTGDWHLHLQCVHDMLSLFAATGHNNYAKGGRLYLQLMSSLPDTHPWLYELFVDHGFHVIRRSDRFWGGLSSDLVIKQTLMKSVKSRGGLTRGRGIDESVRLTWINTMHECANLHQAMSSMADSQSGAQKHVELGATRINRDRRDLHKVLDYLSVNSPFVENDSRLRSLSSGATASAGDGINCNEADVIGNELMRSMDDIKWTEIHMKKSKQVKTLISLQKQCFIGKKPLTIDSSTLFHRLIVLVERSADIPRYFEYELSPVPSSLFKDNFMRKANKSSLARHLTSDLACPDLPLRMSFVIDGGYLIHRVKWLKSLTSTLYI